MESSGETAGKRRMACFEVFNWDEADALDPFAVVHFEEALPPLGAIPGKSHVAEGGSTIYCVTLENPDLGEDDILKVFAKYGFRVRPHRTV